jgi:hypothetical protein
MKELELNEISTEKVQKEMTLRLIKQEKINLSQKSSARKQK